VAANLLTDTIIFSGSRDYSVKGWDVNTGKCKVEFKSPRNIVTAMECSPTDEFVLFQASEDLCIRVWDVRNSSNQPAHQLSGYTYFPICMDMHTDGTMLATGCKGFDMIGCDVKIWDLRQSSKFLCELKGHSQDVTACRYFQLENNTILISASKDGSVIAWINPSAVVTENNNNKVVYNVGRCVTSLVILPMDLSSSSLSNKPSKKLPDRGCRVVVTSNDGSIQFLSLSTPLDGCDVWQFNHIFATSEYVSSFITDS